MFCANSLLFFFCVCDPGQRTSKAWLRVIICLKCECRSSKGAQIWLQEWPTDAVTDPKKTALSPPCSHLLSPVTVMIIKLMFNLCSISIMTQHHRRLRQGCSLQEWFSLDSCQKSRLFYDCESRQILLLLGIRKDFQEIAFSFHWSLMFELALKQMMLWWLVFCTVLYAHIFCLCTRTLCPVFVNLYFVVSWDDPVWSTGC